MSIMIPARMRASRGLMNRRWRHPRPGVGWTVMHPLPSARLGRHRWTIERTGAWLSGWRRLRIRYERDSERFYALVLLACAVICFNALQQPPW
jgi:transposase